MTSLLPEVMGLHCLADQLRARPWEAQAAADVEAAMVSPHSVRASCQPVTAGALRVVRPFDFEVAASSELHTLRLLLAAAAADVGWQLSVAQSAAGGRILDSVDVSVTAGGALSLRLAGTGEVLSRPSDPLGTVLATLVGASPLQVSVADSNGRSIRVPASAQPGRGWLPELPLATGSAWFDALNDAWILGETGLLIDRPKQLAGRDRGPDAPEVALAAVAADLMSSLAAGPTATARVYASGRYDLRPLVGLAGAQARGLRDIRLIVLLQDRSVDLAEVAEYTEGWLSSSLLTRLLTSAAADMTSVSDQPTSAQKEGLGP
ncbi:MAG: hypothetical protein QOE53_387 [Pseudonocardiales bacterium]|nr:hypothetical protein [Pseudonocardiales bacterium]